jgi:hypothetical protein
VKTTLIPALVILGWIGLLANVPAVAQYGASAPVTTRPASSVSLSASLAQATPDYQAAAAAAPMPAGGSSDASGTAVYPMQSPYPTAQTPTGGIPASSTMPNGAAGNATMADNGLWEGASVGPGCSKCGGGNACPPDWYTLQGVNVLSRSKPRNIALSFEAPRGGTFGFAQDPTDPTAPFHLVNNVPLPFALTSTEVLSTTTSATTNISAVPNPTTATEILNTKEMGLNVAPGYDVTIGHYFCRDKNNNDHFVEFTFWGLNSWSAAKSIDGYRVPIYDTTTDYTPDSPQMVFAGQGSPIPTGQFQGSLRTLYPLAGTTDFPGASDAQKTLSLAFNYGTNQTFDYRSSMNNFEIDGRICPRGEPDRLVLHPDGLWRRECQPGMYMSYLYGLRFMEIDETFRFHSQSTGQYGNDGTIPVQDAVGDYDAVTHNSLVGLQIGADITFRNCKWTWGVQSKLGGFINFASQSSVIDAAAIDGTPRPGFNSAFASSAEPVALIGDVGFQATYKFRPNLVGRAAWDFMWISGVALAPEQLQFVADPVNKVNTHGSIFSQGVTLGLEWLW